MGRASTFTVLAATEIINNGETGVTGNIGVYPGNTIVNEAGITIEKGRAEKGTEIAAGAQADALAAYNSLAASSPAIPLLPVIGRGIELIPGTYKISGNLSLQGVLTLNGLNNLNSVFIIIVDGSMSSNSLTAGVRLVNGAQAKNVYWVVSGGVEFGELAGIQGTFIAKQDVVLHKGVVVSGRAISLNGKVVLNQNNLYMPTLVEPNLTITKTAPAGNYVIGDEITYTITVRNAGSGIATGVVVQDFPSASLEYVTGSAVFTEGTFDASTLTWTLGELQFGETRTIQLTFKITGTGTVVNTAAADSNETDPEDDRDTDEEVIEVGCQQVNSLAITGNTSVCEGDNVVYTASAIPGATYTFTLSGGLTQVSQSGNTITVSGGATPGTVSVSAQDQCGKTYTATQEVSVVNRLADPVIVGLPTVCQNGTDYIYSVAAYGDGVTYTWETTGDLRITAGNNTPAVQLSVGAAGGTLTLVANNSCFTTGRATQVIATTSALLAGPTSITGSSEVCAGTEVTYSTSTVIGADNYTWRLPSDDWEIVSGEGTRSIRVKVGSQSGDISVIASNICGSTSAVSLGVEVNTVPDMPIIAGDASGCVGASMTFSTPAVAGTTAYNWAVPETWTLLSGRNTNSIVVEVGTGIGQVSLSIANACGTSETATLNVAPAAGPLTTNQIVGEATICEAMQQTYTLATIEDGVTYTWAVPTGSGWRIVSGEGTGTITVEAGTAGGDITVVASNACASAPQISKAVSVTPKPVTPTAIQDNSNVCDGLTYSIAATTGATSYVWTVPAGFTITSGQGTTSITVKADNANAVGGLITVTAFNGSCSSATTSSNIDASLANGNMNFPKAFSPNGDGINDTWVISNLTKYDQNEVTIFNRWGSEVFKKNNYENDWRGSNLEQGTYFYKVRVTVCGGVVKEFTGYVTLIR
ncbi:ice-binding family protein [Pontibacter sp. CAU 1760]